MINIKLFSSYKKKKKQQSSVWTQVHKFSYVNHFDEQILHKSNLFNQI